MKIARVSIVLFLSFLFSTCGNKSQAASDKTNEPGNRLVNDIKYPIILDLNKKYSERVVNIQDIADVEYIPLETRKNVLIGENYKMLITDNYIICCNRGKDEFLFFDKKGRFLKSFCHKGGSGQEYQNVNGWAYDELSDELFVNDSFFKKRVLVYSSNGQFKRKFQTSIKLCKLMLFDNKNLIVRKPYPYEEYIKTSKKSYDYLLLSRKDGHITSTIPMGVAQKIPTILDRKGFSYFPYNPKDIVNYGRGFFLADISSDTIFKLKSNLKPEPFIIRKPALKNQNNKSLVSQVLCMTDKYTFLAQSNYSYGAGLPRVTNVLTYAVDLQKKDIFYPNLKNKDFPTDNFNMYFFADIRTPQNSAAKLVEASDLLEALDDNKLSGSLKKVALTLKEDDNPVVMILKFKS